MLQTCPGFLIPKLGNYEFMSTLIAKKKMTPTLEAERNVIRLGHNNLKGEKKINGQSIQNGCLGLTHNLHINTKPSHFSHKILKKLGVVWNKVI